VKKSQPLSPDLNKTTEGGKFKPQLAASALVEAAYYGDIKAAERWDVTVRTVQNWRNRLDDDAEFSAIFAHKKEMFEEGWRDEIGSAIRAGIEFLKRAALTADVKKPDVIYSIAGAVKILSDIRNGSDLLNARLAEFNRQARQANQEMAAESTADGEG